MLFFRNITPKTLLARFMLIIIVPILTGQILAVYLFYDRHWYNVTHYVSNVIADEIKLLVDSYENNDYTTQNLITDYLSLYHKFYYGGKLPGKQPGLYEELAIFKNILNSKIHKNNVVKINDEGKIEVLFELQNGLIQINFSSKLLINPTTYIFVLWLIFLTITLLLVSIIFLRNQVRSILELADAADKFGQGVPALKPYKPSGATEIRKAGLAFLKMKERIERQISKRTQMLAMISHDLCTPLTRMKLQLELMQNSEETTELKEDIENMRQMISAYLDFARGEGGEEFEYINISSWIRGLVKSNSASQNIELNIKSKVKVQIKPHAFKRAISNLINNAIKHSTKVKISVYSTTSTVIIEIEDNGAGISDEEKILVFKPFYRSDKSRHLDNFGNVGLGLAITKEIINGHYGSISLEDSKDLGGLLVKITLQKLKE